MRAASVVASLASRALSSGFSSSTLTLGDCNRIRIVLRIDAYMARVTSPGATPARPTPVKWITVGIPSPAAAVSAPNRTASDQNQALVKYPVRSTITSVLPAGLNMLMRPPSPSPVTASAATV